ncbi:MAG: hypothetical protein ACMXYF_03335 [Candidatus Woesearchaeota archaeon]
MSEKFTISLGVIEAPPGSSADQLAKVVLERLGLQPKKRGSTEHMHKTLVEFYERAKHATAKKDQKLAVLTVDEMALFAKISRQTMYEYLSRWTAIGLIQKVTYIDDQKKVIIGYKLSGSSLSDAFAKVKSVVAEQLEQTSQYIDALQRSLKNEKIAEKMRQNRTENSE